MAALRQLLVPSIALLSLSGAQASIIANGGSSDVLTAGPGVGYVADFFDDAVPIVHGWDELQSTTLATGLDVDITAPGVYASTASLTPGTLAAGSVVSSHMLYFDPMANATATASFQFDGTIVGVIVVDDAAADPYVASDFLVPGSVPSGNIPSGYFAARGLELGPNSDGISVGVDTVKVDLSAGSPGDQIRVLTVVPEPGTLLALAGGLVAFRKRGKAAS